MSHIIDTHVHLDFSEFTPDMDRILSDSKLCGVQKFLIPGASLKTLQNAYNLATKHSEIYFAVGIHPCDINEILSVQDFMQEQTKNAHLDSIKLHILELFKPFIESKKCVGVGECGLDFYRLENLDSMQVKAAQNAIFKAQIEIALQYNLPLILHVRDSKDNDDATTNIATILREYYKYDNLRGVFHCFNANEKLLAFSDRFYYGIGGILTFKNAQNLVEILPKIPHDRILLETDAPFLAPIPHRGKRNEPKYLVHIAEKIAQILNITQEKVCEMTSKNAQKLFGI